MARPSDGWGGCIAGVAALALWALAAWKFEASGDNAVNYAGRDRALAGRVVVWEPDGRGHWRPDH